MKDIIDFIRFYGWLFIIAPLMFLGLCVACISSGIINWMVNEFKPKKEDHAKKVL